MLSFFNTHIVGNKNEDPRSKVVDTVTVNDFAGKRNLEYLEVSAKSGANVEEVTFIQILSLANINKICIFFN